MSSSICAIVPTYNRAGMLRDCIDSILAQTRIPDKIIVVNDGSTDNTEEIIKSYGDRLTLLTKANGGKSTALNVALANCETDYIWICDDDDVAAPDGLERLAEVLDNDLNIDFVLGTYRMFYGNFSEQAYVDPPLKVRSDETDIKILFLEDMFTCQFAMLVRRSLYQMVGPFRDDMVRSQDYEMSIRLSQSGKGVRVPDIIFFQRQHTGIRGTAKESFHANNNFQKWLVYDQKIFKALYDTLPLVEYMPSFAKEWNTELSIRAAMIERGSVFARRGLWDYAIKDFRSAAELLCGEISSKEVQILETVTGFEPAWQVLLSDWHRIRQLRNIYQLNLNGRHIVIALCRPLVWYVKNSIKNRRYAHSLSMMQLLYRILKARGMISRLSKSFIG